MTYTPYRKLRPLIGATAALLLAGCATSDRLPSQSTFRIEPGDDSLAVVRKAAHTVPSANQLAALEREFIAFVHFGPNTFTRKEWGNGMEDPRVFDLRTLDTDQWCEAMKAAGMKMVIITAKHHDGFVLWQSRYTTHGVMSSPYKDGKGDIVKELSRSCQKYGLKLGIYLSPADLYQIESPQGLYGNLSQKTRRVIPREVPGRPFANQTKFEFVVDDYNEYYLNQLFELLTEYGPIHEVWLDGAHPKRKGGQTYDYQAWKKLIHTLAPEAVVFGREDVRWCGNEAGRTRDVERNVIAYPADPDTMNHFADMMDYDLSSIGKLRRAPYIHYQQAETNTSIREGWFYRDDTGQQVRSADDVFDIYERAVGGNSIFLLNIPPNREGRFSPADVESLREAGRRIRETYGTDLLDGASGPKALLDDKADTYVTLKGKRRTLTISTPEPITLNRLTFQEAIAQRGERIDSMAVDAWIDGRWQTIAATVNVGYKRILRFPDVTTDRLRLRLLRSRLDPALSHVSAHYYRPRPPRLVVRQDHEGRVHIAPMPQSFRWNPNGQDAVANLNAGYQIRYTTDGSEPTASSPLYDKPLALSHGTLKAAAFLSGQVGPTAQERIGLPKQAWRLVQASGEADKHPATAAFDADATTYWQATAGDKGTLTLDLGRNCAVEGFAYQPPVGLGKSLMAAGELLVSLDGKEWTSAGTFEFGNLVNDPSKRYHLLSRPVEARYVRFRATALAPADSNAATVAELDVFGR